jgi:hypothetical protein
MPESHEHLAVCERGEAAADDFVGPASAGRDAATSRKPPEGGPACLTGR